MVESTFLLALPGSKERHTCKKQDFVAAAKLGYY